MTIVRTRSGVPAGGQFATSPRGEAAGVHLGAPTLHRVLDAWGDVVELTAGVLDDDALWVYRNGQCLALAVAIANHQGWPVVVHTMSPADATDDPNLPNEMRHAYAQAPDGTLVDVYGENDADVIELEDGETLTVCTAREAVDQYAFCLPDQDYAAAATFTAAVLASLG